jgi:hypothetical protein
MTDALTIALFGRPNIAPTRWPARARFVHRMHDESAPGEGRAARASESVRADSLSALTLAAVGHAGARPLEVLSAVQLTRPATTRIQIGTALGWLVSTGRLRRREDGVYVANAR